jgi:threonine dehydratase
VIAGQGTISLETLDEVPGLDARVIAVGGGGLFSGIAVGLPGTHASRIVRAHAADLLRVTEAQIEHAIVTLPRTSRRSSTSGS